MSESPDYTDTSLAPKATREIWAVLRLRIPEDMTMEDAVRELARSVEFGRPVIDVIPARPGERRPTCPVCLEWPHRFWCEGFRPRSGPRNIATLACKALGFPEGIPA